MKFTTIIEYLTGSKKWMEKEIKANIWASPVIFQ